MPSLFTVLLSISVFSVLGQSTLDSLSQLIAQENNPKKKLALLNTRTFVAFDIDLMKANQFSEQAVEQARKTGDQSGEGWALVYRGVYFLLSGSLHEAKTSIDQALLLSQKIKDLNLQTYCLTQKANVFRDEGAFDSSVFYYRQADKLGQQTKDNYYWSVAKVNLGRYFLTVRQPDSALRVIDEALKLRTELQDSILLAGTWILMGNCYRGKDDFVTASLFYQKALPLVKKNETIAAEYRENMGRIYFRMGDFQRALENWSQGLAYQRKHQYKYGLAEQLLRMGAVFDQEGYFDIATEYLTNALKIAERASYQYLVGKIIYEQAWVYYRTKNYDLALASRQKAEQIFRKTKSVLDMAGCWDLRGLIERRKKNYDTALYYHKKSLEERIRLGHKVDIDASLFNIGEFYAATGKLDQALSFYFKSLSMDNGIRDSYGKSLNYNRIGNIYTQLSRFDSAKFYLEKSMQFAIPTSSFEIFRTNYLDFATYYEKLGKPKQATEYYKKYIRLSDSIFNKQMAESLASYRTLYDVERNEQQIELLNKDNLLTKLLVQKQETILYTIVAGSLLLFGLAIFYYRFTGKLRKINLSLSEKNEEIQTQSEELVEANDTLSKLNREIHDQSEEIQMQAEELMEINTSLEDRVEARTLELKQAFKELDTFFYRSSHDFRRPLTTFMGLAEVAKVLVKEQAALELFEKVNDNALTLDKMLRKLQSISDVDVQTLIYKEVPIKEIFEIELAIMRQELDHKKIKVQLSINLTQSFYSYGALIKIVIQNLLENSIAFCAPEAPFIQLSAFERGQEVVIEVKDNGVGIRPEYINTVFEMYFRANEHSKGNGLGLYIVKKAVQKLNGRIELQSILGEGTTVRMFLPKRLDLKP